MKVINDDKDYKKISDKIGFLIVDFRRAVCGQDSEEMCLDHLNHSTSHIRAYRLSEFYQSLEKAANDIRHILYEKLNQ